MAELSKEAVQAMIARGELPTANQVASTLSEPQIELASRRVDDIEPKVKILEQANYVPKSNTVDDFVKYYRKRYEFLKSLLLNRPNTTDAVSIGKLSYTGASKATIIGMVSDMQQFSTGTVKLRVEDLSGTINAIMPAKNKELLAQADFLALDEVIALRGSVSRRTFFVDEIIWPDVPQRPKKTTTQEVYAAFSGDLHAGSNTFLPKKLTRFVSWLKGEQGDTKQRELAKKTKYVFIQGDVVDGIGIYPGQEKELYVTDIYKQYDLVADFVKEIPSDKIVIICPGNHDAMRLAEPQPPLPKDFAARLYDLPNVVCVGNPCSVNIHAVNGQQGFDVLMYHGYSFAYFLEKVKGLRDAGGFSAPDKLIEFLLKRRHLAPSYESTLKVPMYSDPLLIRQVPDIFTTGHIHKIALNSYRGVLTIASSCWQRNTSFQDRVGIKADPAKVPLVNLKTRKAQVLDFN